MAVVMRFFRLLKRAWQKITSWVFFWRRKTKLTVTGRSGSKKCAGREAEETSKTTETFKLVPSLGEATLPELDECRKLAEPCVLAKAIGGTELEPGREGPSFLRLPQTAVRSVSTLMVSALQTGWQMCSWKSSVSSVSIASPLRTQSPLETLQAEMLWEMYLVLLAIRKQLRLLARRQERRRRRHVRAHTSPQPSPVQCLKLDARSPL
ncbi:uncharacterized protein C7orf61 homolog [Carlito syrichta]|uniref:Uncharacterized protein C7orf61 homolog n=1 Tax=Carlito syrichta TaxID=1868482 RepID=A0A1U7SS26_CARSF|nr:uncharacterized protein C7orf61 homolog [Carlito syrichta]